MAGSLKALDPIVSGAASVVAHGDATQLDADMFDIRGFTAGSVKPGTGITTLTYWASNDGVTFFPMYDKAVTAVTQTVVADRWYALPDAVFSFSFIQIVTNTDGVLTLMMKRVSSQQR